MTSHPSDRLRQAAQIVSGACECVDPDTARLLTQAVELVTGVATELEDEELADIMRDPDGVMAAVQKRMRRVA